MRYLIGLVFLCFAASARAEPPLVILGGDPGGVYAPLARALASGIGESVPGRNVEVKDTAGSPENILLLQAGQGDLAFAQGDLVSEAWKGNRDLGFPGKMDHLRAIAGLYPDYLQIVVAPGAGIAGPAGLKGKRVGVGAVRSGTELTTRAVLKAAGLTYRDFSETKLVAFDESMAMLLAGTIDGFFVMAGLDTPALASAAAAAKVAFVPVPPSLVEALGDPVYVPTSIPANFYGGGQPEVPTVSIRNQLITRAEVSEDLAYRLTEALFASHDALAAAHPNGKWITLDARATLSPVPLHPGAARFYREHKLLGD
ncbi:MAG: TAXI family TRAP transporter solute-binding subunit [Azospirillum sp.]|nr:TAXI family TRAP transporter solute-binding subunit [Azospirillum sp.]